METAFSCNIKKDFDKKEGIVECDLCVTSVAVSSYNPSIKSKTWSERFFQRNFLRRSREENFFEKRKPERGDKTFLIYLYYRE